MGEARHNGTAYGNTYRIDPATSVDGMVIGASGSTTSSSAYTQIDGIRMTGLAGAAIKAMRVYANNVKVDNVLIEGATGATADAIYLDSSSLAFTLQNSVFYNIGRSALTFVARTNMDATVRNVTVYNGCSAATTCTAGTGRFGVIGVDTNDNNSTNRIQVYNTFVDANSTKNAFRNDSDSPSLWGSSSNNMAKDATAPGTPSQHGDDHHQRFSGAGNYFIVSNTTAGKEDFRLQNSVDNDARNTGSI